MPTAAGMVSTVLESRSLVSSARSASRRAWAAFSSMILRTGGDAAGGGPLGQLARQQEVARVSVGHVRHFALVAQLVNVLQ